MGGVPATADATQHNADDDDDDDDNRDDDGDNLHGHMRVRDQGPRRRLEMVGGSGPHQEGSEYVTRIVAFGRQVFAFSVVLVIGPRGSRRVFTVVYPGAKTRAFREWQDAL